MSFPWSSGFWIKAQFFKAILRVMLSFLSCDLSPIYMCPLKHIIPLCKLVTPAKSFPEESNLTTSHIIKILFFMHWWICLLGRHIVSSCIGSCNIQNLLCNTAGKACIFRVGVFLGVCLIFFPLLFILLYLISYTWLRTFPVSKDCFEQFCLQNACCCLSNWHQLQIL